MSSSVKITYFLSKSVTRKIRLSITLAMAVMMFVIPSAFSESAEIKKVPFNTYVNEVYGFSITPPTDWIVEAPMVHEDPEILPSLFGAYYEIPDKEYDPLITIEYLNYPLLAEIFYTDEKEEFLDGVVKAYSENFDNTSQTKILEKSIINFQEGYMSRILITYILTAENFEEPISAKSEFVNIWMPNGDRFKIYFTTRIEDYEKYSQFFEESLSTFYLGNVEKLPSPKPSFVDPKKDPQYYLDRYYNEPEYKDWFDRNYPDYTIEEAVSLEIKSKIPEWVKNIFGWYSQGQIDDGELIKALQFLIKEGIIKV